MQQTFLLGYPDLGTGQMFLEVGDKCRRGLGICPDNSFSIQSSRLLLISMPKDKTRSDPI